MMTVALRGRVEGFAAIRKVTVLEPVPVPPEAMVAQLTGLEALQLQVLEEAPTAMPRRVVLAVIEIGNVGIENEQVDVLEVPTCITVTVIPAMVSVALRAVADVFAAIERVTVPVPVPLAPSVMVIQLTVLVVVQAHVLEDALTVNLTPSLLALTEIGEGTSNEQEDVLLAPACVTVTDFPAMVSVALRAVVAVFAASARATEPVPAPLAPAVTVIQLGALVVVQVQVLADGVTFTLLLVAPAPTETLVVDTV